MRDCSRQRASENHGKGSTNFSCSCVKSGLNPLVLWVTKQTNWFVDSSVVEEFGDVV